MILNNTSTITCKPWLLLWWVLLIWLELLGCLWVPLQASNVIHITNSNWPPYQSMHAKHFGAASHLVTEIFKVSNIGVQFDFLPDNRAITLTKAGFYDATFLWAYSSDREKHFEYSPPLIMIEEVLLGLSNNERIINDYEQLKNDRIGVVLGFYYGEDFEKAKADFDLHIKSATTNEENIARLLSNKVDFIIGVPTNVKLILRQYYPNELTRIRAQPLVVQRADYYVLFSKKSPYLERWKETFEFGYAQLKKNQLFDHIIESVLSGEYDPPIE